MNTEFEQSYKLLAELIGSKVELVISSGLYKGNYPSRLEEHDNDLVGLAHPMLKGAFLPAMRSTEMLMKIEASNCFYQATVSVIRGVLKAAVPLLWVKMASNLDKVQRRMFVRVPCSLRADAFFMVLNEEVSEEVVLPPCKWFAVNISDLSLGGAGILIKDTLSSYCIEGGRYILRLNIGGTVFFLVGKLVKILRRNEGFVEVGIAYEGLAAFTEKIMGSYIRQQELVSRG